MTELTQEAKDKQEALKEADLNHEKKIAKEGISTDSRSDAEIKHDIDAIDPQELNLIVASAPPSEEKKAKPPKKSLPKESRELLREKLKHIGIDTQGLSDAELIEKVAFQAGDLFDHKVKTTIQASDLKMILEAYAYDTLLKDQEFLEELYHLNVPKIYLQLFRDQDKTLEARQIWERIRSSNIRPESKVNEIFRQKGKRSTKRAKRIYFDQY